MKKSRGVLAIATILIGVLFAFSSCEQTTSTEFEETFQKVKEVTPIPGAQNVTMDLDYGDNQDQDSYFVVNLNNGKTIDGWCIEWNESSIQGSQEGTKMYSTKGQEAWKELNYFMSIKDHLRASDPELTYKEIQVIIWSLIDNPSFDVDKISEYDNINSRIYNNGEVQFNVQKVKDIVSQVNNHFASAKSKTDAEYPGMSLIENDGQTIMVGDETAFAVKTDNGAVDPDYSTCFNEEIIEDISFPRWGWTNNLTVPSADNSPLTLTYDLYAGAGQCDLSKGTRVGELDVTLTSDGNLTVTYRMTETSGFTGESYTISETHLYVGNDLYPTGNSGKYTVAPGQYGETQGHHDNVDEVTYEVEDLTGSIYFIAHAVVDGFDPGADD